MFIRMRRSLRGPALLAVAVLTTLVAGCGSSSSSNGSGSSKLSLVAYSTPK